MGKITLLSVVVLMLAGVSRAAEPRRFSYTETHMGTRFKIIVYAKDPATADRAAQAAFARVATLDGIMSDYKKTSELMRLCRKAGGDPVPVSKELFFVLKKSKELSKKSDGAFDVTIGPVVKLWRRARKAIRLPDPKELAAARKLVGHDKMKLDPDKRTIQLTREGMLLDLGGIAKGYAADEALRVLKEHGLTRALVAAAGDIAVGDAPPGAKGWTVGIAPVDDPDAEPKKSLLLENAAVSTSGDARQYVTIDGKRYSHIVDPRTGVGVLGQFSVTVVARRAIDTDALATAVSVLGADKGLPLIEKEGAAALIVTKHGKNEKAVKSKGFNKYEKK